MKGSAVFTCYLAGTESLLLQCADILLSRGHQILGVVSSDAVTRRAAEERGLATLRLDGTLRAALRAAPCDYFFSITNLQVLPPEIVEAPRRMAINFHDGPLPRYAGLHATTWALLEGATDYAITWHRVTPHGIDDGEILWQEPVAIEPGETALALNARCYEAAIRSFAVLVDGLETGTLTPRAQDLSQRSYFSRVRRPAGAGALRWDEPAARVAATIAALDFGPYPNPLTLPKVWSGNAAFVVGQAHVAATASGLTPGTVVASTPGRLVVAAADGDVECGVVASATGLPLTPEEAAAHPAAGTGLRRWLPADLERWTATHEALAAHERFWVARLASADPVAPPVPDLRAATGAGAGARVDTAIGGDAQALWRARCGAADAADAVVALIAAFLRRTSGRPSVDVAYSDGALRRHAEGAAPLFSMWVPFGLRVPDGATVDAAVTTAVAELTAVRARATFARDVVARVPALRARGAEALPERWPVGILVGDAVTAAAPTALVIGVAADGSAVAWHGADGNALKAVARQFDAFMRDALAHGDTPLGQCALIDEADSRRLLVDWNATAAPYPADRALHHWVEAQAARTPDATALVWEHESCTYAALNARANRIARRLRQAGVGHGAIVGVAVPRSIDMVCATLAVLKLGAAYLPLDPDYPAERLRFMLADSGAAVVLEAAPRPGTRVPDVAVVVLGDPSEEATIAGLDATDLDVPVAGGDVAYMIYTSGSTGTPKGVLVEHRNVANFFTGMDRTIAHEPPGVWLAVTSLSFDISVLEIFWTLARGFMVVLQSDARNVTGEPNAVAGRQPIDFSLFYFASDEGSAGASKYALLLEGAKFADANGFHSVWTPERHFHAFGGLYPNPSVTSAAVAAVTTRVGIRAGSVVLPLHHPIRVAEEWALVDNLSGGRVGVSFASGWHPDDFVLRPEAFADAKHRMMADLETVRRLWRGERVAFPGPLGKDVEVSTLPRPVQAELPTWITAAGNPETFRLAGEAGCNVLTHLLGQSLEELADKVAVYRRAWRQAGHGPGGGRVTLMLHTFVGDSDARVRETVRGPMKRYLGSAVNLIKQYAWSFPAFKKRTESAGASSGDIFAQLSAEDLDGLLDHAFERYYDTSGLFGTPETCLRMITRLKALGIEEVACLIDFGVPHGEVIESLPRLARLRQLAADVPALDARDQSIPAAIVRHGVTHLQCTPSLAGVLVRDPDARLALGRLRHMLVGGEAISATLAGGLLNALRGRLTNMYGPTETTVWSTVHDISPEDGPVPIGRPIANTTVYVLDAQRELVPPGVPGELYIGGAGVARGYHGRPDETAERFVRDPFGADAGARLYRTGDQARHRPDGTLEFLGRGDGQVKVRGFRIELGEIEACGHQHPGVREFVVAARPAQDGDHVLVAYVVPRAGADAVTDDVRAFLRARLPAHCVPTTFVTLAGLPLTPNGKVDRQRLPDPAAVLAAAATPLARAESDLERTVAQVWADVLQVPEVGLDQNFFDLGGHSLLTVRVLGQLRDATGRRLAITDMFRFPTVRTLAKYMTADAGDTAAMSASQDRGAARRERLSQRRRPGA